MGQTQSKFDLQDVELANFSRALALPARVMIVRILMEQQDWVTSSTFKELPLAPEVTEKHLNALRVVKLVNKMTRNGITFYQLNFELFKAMSTQLAILVSEIASHEPHK
ncbi:hypothetical protein [Mucilaginibacter sp.]|jgi:hypothetical protein|uniref:hypothetical protein n=1 Tax=Mucilaginibacter sp. TaxID=1882438 RepID=UPI0035661C77